MTNREKIESVFGFKITEAIPCSYYGPGRDECPRVMMKSIRCGDCPWWDEEYDSEGDNK